MDFMDYKPTCSDVLHYLDLVAENNVASLFAWHCGKHNATIFLDRWYWRNYTSGPGYWFGVERPIGDTNEETAIQWAFVRAFRDRLQKFAGQSDRLEDYVRAEDTGWWELKNLSDLLWVIGRGIPLSKDEAWEIQAIRRMLLPVRCQTVLMAFHTESLWYKYGEEFFATRQDLQRFAKDNDDFWTFLTSIGVTEREPIDDFISSVIGWIGSSSVEWSGDDDETYVYPAAIDLSLILKAHQSHHGHFLEGFGFPIATAEAVEAIQRAAALGYALAQFNLGILYHEGRGVPADDRAAVDWLRKAATQGHLGAWKILRQFYVLDRGESVNRAEAALTNQFGEMHEPGDPFDQWMRGVCLTEGRGVNWSDEEALVWFEKATEQVYAAACRVLTREAEAREQGQRASEKVLALSHGAESGDAEAHYHLGLCYERGQTVAQDYAQAVAWYLKAADHGHAVAQDRLGYLYREGRGCVQDLVISYMWYSLAAKQGHPFAIGSQARLARALSQGQIEAAGRLVEAAVPKNPEV